MTEMMKATIARLAEFRIGQRVMFISRDAGIPDSEEIIVGMEVGYSGLENITLCGVDNQGIADGYTLADIRPITTVKGDS